MNDLPVVILGQMGSGKDTLARRLVAEYGYTRNHGAAPYGVALFYMFKG